MTLLLTHAGIGNTTEVQGEPLDARIATLLALEQDTDGLLGDRITDTYELTEDPTDTGGPLEPDGRYGRLLHNLAIVEGEYTFHARYVRPRLHRHARDLLVGARRRGNRS